MLRKGNIYSIIIILVLLKILKNMDMVNIIIIYVHIFPESPPKKLNLFIL